MAPVSFHRPCPIVTPGFSLLRPHRAVGFREENSVVIIVSDCVKGDWEAAEDIYKELFGRITSISSIGMEISE